MADHMTTYRWVIETRKTLLDFLSTLPSDAFTREHEQFGHRSIRNTLFHVAECYRWWLDWFVNESEPPKRDASLLPDVESFRKEFAEVDALAERFLVEHGKTIDSPQTHHVKWEHSPITATPRWLVTHAITHEFHHKGVIVSLARVLGHPPVETDLYLPSSF